LKKYWDGILGNCSSLPIHGRGSSRQMQMPQHGSENILKSSARETSRLGKVVVFALHPSSGPSLPAKPWSPANKGVCYLMPSTFTVWLFVQWTLEKQQTHFTQTIKNA